MTDTREYWLTTQDVAAELGVSARRVNQLIAAGRLPAKRFGGMHLIAIADVDAVRDRPAGRPKK